MSAVDRNQFNGGSSVSSSPANIDIGSRRLFCVLSVLVPGAGDEKNNLVFRILCVGCVSCRGAALP